MEIEIKSITINLPWWLILAICFALISKVKPKHLFRLIKDWIKDD
jgi:hypothetical protein